MVPRRFIQCDVFTPTPTLGNGLAVVVDGEGLCDEEMQSFATWMNLAETTFLLPPTDARADYRVRIFTPGRELPFAGHPTLGSCAAWLHVGGVPRQAGVVRQECGVGIVEVDVSQAGLLSFKAPPTKIQPLDPQRLEALVQTLRIPLDAIVNTAQLDNGPVWQALELRSAEAVLAADSSYARWPLFQTIGLIGARAPGAECDYEVRMLAPSSGMHEDPITGSLNAALAHWLQAQGRLPGPICVSQGVSIGRQGRVSIRPEPTGEVIWIGGQVHILVEGELHF